MHFPKGPHHLSSLCCFTVLITNTSLQTPSTLSSLKNTQLISWSECFSLQVSGTQLYSFEYKRHSVSHSLEIQKSRTAGSRGSRMMNNFCLSLLCLPPLRVLFPSSEYDSLITLELNSPKIHGLRERGSLQSLMWPWCFLHYMPSLHQSLWTEIHCC